MPQPVYQPARRALNSTTSSFHHSRGIQVGNLIFLAGHVARAGGTGPVQELGIAGQTREVLRQLDATLNLAGASLADLVQVSVFITDTSLFAEFDAAYAAFFPDAPPARTTVVSELLPVGALVELNGIAALTDASR